LWIWDFKVLDLGVVLSHHLRKILGKRSRSPGERREHLTVGK